MKQALAKANKKGYISVVGYSTAIVLGFFMPAISGLIYVSIAIMWIVPERSIESAVKGQ
jgi:hypothetical protein